MSKIIDTRLISREEPFSGSFAELLGEIKKYPAMVESAKARLHRLITRYGIDERRSAEIQRIYGKEGLVAYNAFSSFYGIDSPIYLVVNNYLGAAVMGAEADKQALVVIGPPGSGKSDFFTRVKQIYRTAEPIPYLGGSRIHDNPLNILFMIDRVARERSGGKMSNKKGEVVKILNSLGIADLINWNAPDCAAVITRNGVTPDVEGLASLPVDDMVSAIVFGLGLPRSTRNNIGRPEPMVQDLLLGKFVNKGAPIDIADFPIESMFFDSDDEGSAGIVDVPEVQPLNFDIGTWIGTENLAMMGRLPSGDPRLVEFNGAYNKGNRGLVIKTEGLKNPPEAQRVTLEALQGRRVGIPAPLGGSLHFDGLVIIHSNEGEYDRFIKERVNEPYVDRFWRIWFPYPLEARQVKKVHEKFWKGSDFAKPETDGGVHVDPDVFDYTSRLAVLTALEQHPAVPLATKLDAYDGRDIRQKGMGTKVSATELRQQASPREGLSGMSPREVAKIVNAIAAEVGSGKAVTSRMVRDRASEWFRSNVQDEEKLKKLQGLIANELDTWRAKNRKQVWLAAMVPSFKDECQDVWERYLDNIQAFARDKSVRMTGYGRGPVGGDEGFMREIESDPDWGVTSAEAPKFRAEILAAVMQHTTETRSSTVPYSCHDSLKNCIERYVLRKVQETARTFSTTSARSEEDKRKLSEVKRRLIEDFGFNEFSADELLREAEESKGFMLVK
jgi:serine protein kinase